MPDRVAITSCVMLATFWVAMVSSAQTPVGVDPWPGLGLPERAPPPIERDPDAAPLQVLPPLPAPPEAPPPLSEARFVLAQVRFVGNTVVDDAVLESLVAPWIGRAISTSELLDLRNAITRHYIENGYISSGARIPDQVPENGVVVVELVEGRLDEIEFVTPTRIDPRYVERRLRHDARQPLRLETLERRLRIIQESAGLQRIDARIEPGVEAGRDRLVLSIEEHPMLFGWSRGGTLVSPSIGGYAARVGAQVTSAAGQADRARFLLSGAEGLLDFQGEYAMPFGVYDTTVTLRGRYGESKVVADPIDDLEIETHFAMLGLELSQPIWRERDQRVDLGIIADWQEGKTYLDGRRQSFTEGAENGRFRVSVLRTYLMARFQTARQVLALRSTWSLGVDVLGATKQPSGLEDGRFFSWLGQVQLLRSLEILPLDVLLRANVQIADDRLLPVERFSVGGRDSVRGYRESLFVRDNGVAGSLELRWPILRTLERRRTLELFSFVDGGNSWTSDRADDESDDLWGVGFGLRATPWRWLELELSWARRLTERPSVLEKDVQDDGLYFLVQVTSF